MDSLLSTIRAVERRAVESWLFVGALPDAAQELASESSERVDRLEEAEGVFDRVLWRPLATWNSALLRRAASLLGERGRLWMLVRSSLRRQLVLDVGRCGYAVVDESVDGDWAVLRLRHDGYVTRAYQSGDEDDILRLFTPSFHAERSAEHWRWKYEEHPLGRRMITVSRSPDGELAAHYAAYPVLFYDWNHGRPRSLLALQIGDTMTDPRFRRAGRGQTSLLGRCFRHFFVRHCEGRVAFNYGFNTGNIRRFNFQFIKGRLAQTVGFWRRSTTANLDTGTVRGKVTVEKVISFGPEFDRFFARAARHYGFLVKRDARWLDWRYGRCPDAPAFLVLASRSGRRLLGWSVFRRRGDQLAWCDALYLPEHADTAAAVLQAALERPEVAGVGEVVAWFPPHPEWWSRRLPAWGFEPRPEPNDLAMIYLPFTHPEVGERLETAYYTWGDGDLI